MSFDSFVNLKDIYANLWLADGRDFWSFGNGVCAVPRLLQLLGIRNPITARYLRCMYLTLSSFWFRV